MTNVLIEATEDLAVDFRENPARTFANMAGMLEDEVSVVATDEDAGTVVLRIGDSGELVTVDLSGTENWLRDQIQGGVSFDGEADESGGVLRITTSDGDATIEVRGDGDGAFLRVSSSGNEMRLGAGDATAALPDWVPVYPGPTSKNASSPPRPATAPSAPPCCGRMPPRKRSSTGTGTPSTTRRA